MRRVDCEQKVFTPPMAEAASWKQPMTLIQENIVKYTDQTSEDYK